MNEYAGHLVVQPGQRFAIVLSRFNDLIGKRLLEGCRDALLRHGGTEEQIDLFLVPGAFEIPVVCAQAARSGRYAAVICLGAVIRGSTPHFDYVCNEAAKGIASAATATGVPTIFGVLTTDTIEQAIERAGTKSGNKGWDVGVAAIEMANLMAAMPKS